MDEHPIDLSVLDPRRDEARFTATAARVAQRAVELRRLRRAVVRRGITALALAMAAGLALWLVAPKRTASVARQAPDVLDWAMGDDVGATEVLGLGGNHAH